MDRQEWLGKKAKAIGGSECASLLGLNPWMSNVDLWKIKTGRKPKEDISDKPIVKYGCDYEPILISGFGIDYPQYDVFHKEHDLMYHREHSFMVGSFDARLAEIHTGRKGVLEIKTTNILNSTQLDKWKDDNVPDNYFCQLVWYLAVNPEFQFAYLKALLNWKPFADKQVYQEIRHYKFERKNLENDIDIITKAAIEFWGFIERDEEPPLRLNPKI